MISFSLSQIGLIICMQSILNKWHNSKVPSWVMHNLVLCFSTEQGVCHLHSELNVLGLKILAAINGSLWGSMHFSPLRLCTSSYRLPPAELKHSQKREFMVHWEHLVPDQNAECNQSIYSLIISLLCVVQG